MLDPVPVTNYNFVSSTPEEGGIGEEGNTSECSVYVLFRMFILNI